MTLKRSFQRLAAMLSIVALSGCDGAFVTAPVAPERTPVPETGPEILMVDGSSERYVAATDSTAAAEDIVDRSLTVTATIDGKYGGRVRCGRFVLLVPPGAWGGNGDVTMTMPDSTIMLVDLGIYPEKLNAFAIPVRLCLVTDGLVVSVDDLSMYWWDPAASDWKAQTCDKDLSDNPELTYNEYSKGMVIDLSHFSRYSGGKAGW